MGISQVSFLNPRQTRNRADETFSTGAYKRQGITGSARRETAKKPAGRVFKKTRQGFSCKPRIQSSAARSSQELTVPSFSQKL